MSPVLDYGFDPLGFLDKLAASKARARLELDGALFEGPAYLPHPIVARTWAGHFPDEGGADDALLRRAGEMDPQAPRPRCVLDGAFAVVRRRLQAAKRADRRFDKLMLHVEAASLTPLDPAWFTDQSVDYSREFNAVRGLEMASQAQRDAFSSSGSSVLETHMRTVGRSRRPRSGR